MERVNTVTLSSQEMMVGALGGVMRLVMAIKKNRADKTQDNDDAWDVTIEGALAEMAFAKMSGMYWTGCEKFRAGDVSRFEIRMTRHTNGCLLIYPGDNDDSEYVLMIGKRGTYRAAGWLKARDGKRAEYLRPNRGHGSDIYFVPQNVLHPMGESLAGVV